MWTWLDIMKSCKSCEKKHFLTNTHMFLTSWGVVILYVLRRPGCLCSVLTPGYVLLVLVSRPVLFYLVVWFLPWKSKTSMYLLPPLKIKWDIFYLPWKCKKIMHLLATMVQACFCLLRNRKYTDIQNLETIFFLVLTFQIHVLVQYQTSSVFFLICSDTIYNIRMLYIN